MPLPTDLILHKQSRQLEIKFDNGFECQLPAEYLRVLSPSAEVKGHGPGQATLQTNKKSVSIDNIHPVGHYAVKLIFDDGHDSGLYSWDYLHELGVNYDQYWQRYLDQLAKANASRE